MDHVPKPSPGEAPPRISSHPTRDALLSHLKYTRNVWQWYCYGGISLLKTFFNFRSGPEWEPFVAAAAVSLFDDAAQRVDISVSISS